MTLRTPTEADIWIVQMNMVGAVKMALTILTEFKRQQNK